jgi:hypothetical protein
MSTERQAKNVAFAMTMRKQRLGSPNDYFVPEPSDLAPDPSDASLSPLPSLDVDEVESDFEFSFELQPKAPMLETANMQTKLILRNVFINTSFILKQNYQSEFACRQRQANQWNSIPTDSSSN